MWPLLLIRMEFKGTYSKTFGGSSIWMLVVPQSVSWFTSEWAFYSWFLTINFLFQKRFKTKRSLSKHSKNQSENRCEICLRDFCTSIQFNAHKPSCERLVRCDTSIVGCGPSTIGLANSNRCNEMPIKDEFNEPLTNSNQTEPIGIESSSQMANPAPVLITLPSYTAHGQPVDSIEATNQSSKQRYKYGPIECDICGRLFNSKSNFKMHRTTHTDDRPFECWLCHKTWVHSDFLLFLVKICRNDWMKRVYSIICRFRLRATLKMHLVIHTIHSKIRKYWLPFGRN